MRLTPNQIRFVDLFAGLGGFHLALSKIGGKCVFACEIDATLRELYQANFGITPAGDIKSVSATMIPAHDLLCAGFPCQPFSKAGNQKGLKDFERGLLFDDIARVLRHHNPDYFILENVSNLKYHNSKETWKYISHILHDRLKYHIADALLSPHSFGIPQIRERLFIVGSKDGLSHFEWPKPMDGKDLSIRQILDVNPPGARKLPERETRCIELWQEFLDRMPKDAKLPSFPIWSMEFGATYPFKNSTPYACTAKELNHCLGQFGASLFRMPKSDQFERIPKYAREKVRVFPKWKQTFIAQNREFYLQFKKEIDPLLSRIMKLPTSWQKFEWNCQGEERSLKKFIIQFRASGIRVKRPNYSPSLVASTSTQIPIVAWENRYMTIKEGARLQHLETLKMPTTSVTAAFRALGNAVNAKIVSLIAKRLIKDVVSEAELLPLDGPSSNISEVMMTQND